MKMKVTIGIPFYNAERYLAGAIRSVFAQTHADWELVLLDDGSSDGSLGIAKSVQDPRVRVVSDGQNMKLAARLNQIVEMANSDLIVRMDADDLMAPDRIEKQLEVLINNPKVDIVSSGAISISDDYEVLGVRWHYAPRITRDQLLRKSGAGIIHAAVIGRREWFLRNPYDPSVPIAQDYDLWLRSSTKGDLNARIIQYPLYYVREASSISVDKLLHAYKIDRSAIWRNKRKLSDLRYMPKSYAKSIVLRLIASTGNLDWLVRRRNSFVSDPVLLDKFHSDLKLIKSTFVKGL